ncbi:acid phosphatase AphA [Truncatella angustata]|uniref:Purple acid phosphatase n=1 Tax=Truncatella angustata TaxID=152316 RepID=A0A9P8UVP8_9PEZI|nr:acid phosphatase AphA [Truncatella angustata]KAH6659055.1 acid phosphatase AphA [Truncatella angustata]
MHRAAALAAALLVGHTQAAPKLQRHDVRDVDETYPYTGPAVPIGDWVDPTVKGNGRGFPRLVEAPAVTPEFANPTNNVNVVSLSYIPNGVHIHYQTPFGLGEAPSVVWGPKADSLVNEASGTSHTYDRTPPCSELVATQCSQFFHEVQLKNLTADTTYYYKIQAANGTTASDILSFTTGRAAGDVKPFTVAVLNDMGYTNAGGTYEQLLKAASGDTGIAFAWHGGDISYADDWYSGILPCEDSWPLCYNGTSTTLPGGGPIPEEYSVPLPEDMSVLYESNWDLWQQWMNNLTANIPYMVLPGNHEAACGEFDGPNNELSAYLDEDKANSTAPKSTLSYYSCPPTQRNYTAYQHRFRMPGSETGGVSNFWYSFDYGLAHFVSLNGETDYPYSPEWPFVRDLSGNETKPQENETFITDSGPFGTIDGSWKTKESYEQYKWLKKDLASVDRTKTPWVIVMSHRPMYSTESSSYQKYMRDAFEGVMLNHGVDLYLSGHIHWYERLWPMGANGTIDHGSVAKGKNNTYYTNPGVSMAHVINGMAGNIESHSTLNDGESPANITAFLDDKHYGFSKLSIINGNELKWQFVRGDGGVIGDELTLLKKTNCTKNNRDTHSF